MNRKQQALLTVIVTFALVGFCVGAAHQNYVPTIQQMADCSVSVLTDRPGPFGTTVEVSGSGVFIDKGKVLTAKHLWNPAFPKLRIAYNDVVHVAISPEFDRNSDLMILSFPTLMDNLVARMSYDDPPLGADIYMIGSPINKTMAGRVSKGIVSCLSRDNHPSLKDDPTLVRDWSRLVGMDMHAYYGNSGSPIFYEGKVVGIFVGFLYPNRSMHATIYIPVSELDIQK